MGDGWRGDGSFLGVKFFFPREENEMGLVRGGGAAWGAVAAAGVNLLTRNNHCLCVAVSNTPSPLCHGIRNRGLRGAEQCLVG